MACRPRQLAERGLRQLAAGALAKLAVLLVTATGAAQPADTAPPAGGGNRDAPMAPATSPASTSGASAASNSAPTTAPAGRGRCAPDWFAQVYARTHRSVVRIECAGGMGAGFVFHSRRHVATAYHVVAIPRPIRVKFATGRKVKARVVATNAREDLAILELDEPAPGIEPLPAAGAGPVPLGTPVIVIGHPFADLVGEREEGLLNWSVSQGIVSAVGGRMLQTDAAVNPGNSGGPLIGCDGRVLGVVSAKLMAEGIGFATPINLLQALTMQIGREPPERVIAQPMLGLAFALQYNVELALLGLELNLGMALLDRWLLLLSVGQSWAASAEPPEPAIVDRGVSQTFLAAGVHHRWLLSDSFPSVYLGVGLGGAAGYSQVTDKLVSAHLTPAGCGAGECAVDVVVEEREESEWRGWPMVNIHTNLMGGLDVSYTFLPDVTEFRQSYHRLRFGLLF